MADADTETARRQRAEARRSSWGPGEVVRAGAPKPSLYAGTGPAERLTHMTRLCRSLWLAAGGKLSIIPRGELPGEVFRIDRDRARAQR